MSRRMRVAVGTALAIAALAGGSVVPAGAATPAAGRLDPSFGGGDGTVYVPRYRGVSPVSGEVLVGLFLRPGGAYRTVTAGMADSRLDWFNGEVPGYVTVRGYRANGTVDPAFNRGAPQVLRGVIFSTPDPQSMLMTAAMDSAGRVVVASMRVSSDCLGPCQIRLVRVLADGRLDAAYHPIWDHLAIPASYADHTSPSDWSVAVLPDGRARVCVTSAGGFPAQVVTSVFGYTAAGATESSFGTGELPGVATLPSGVARCEATAADSAGRLMIASTGLLVSRLTVRGRLDTTFGALGTARVSNWGRRLSPRSITVVGDGSLYVAGSSEAYAGPTVGTPRAIGTFVARLYGSGAPAVRFGRLGVSVITAPARRSGIMWRLGLSSIDTLSVDAAKRVYVPVAAAAADAWRGVVPGWVRLNGYTGARDATWGVNGFVALRSSRRADQWAGPVRQVSSTRLLTGATLAVSGSATGAVIQRRYSR